MTFKKLSNSRPTPTALRLVTWDIPGRSMNVRTTPDHRKTRAPLSIRHGRLPRSKGVVITSGKEAFSAVRTSRVLPRDMETKTFGPSAESKRQGKQHTDAVR